mmetsp:Transcript_18983/g.38704  ORF Transcript_18983/g.38704 Transcript_18983/m.38704 type:complete len:220 (-) Transcript_18983:247-906(-)
MEAQDISAALDVRVRHHHVTVEPPGAGESLVEDFGEVGRRYHHYPFGGVEAIHFSEQLVQRHAHVLLVLRIPRGSDGVDFVDEEDAGGLAFGGVEEVAHSPRAHPHVHLLELRARGVEEGDSSLPGNSLGEQSLASAGGAHEEDTLGHLPPQPCELLRVLEKVDDLEELVLGLVDAHHVLELLAALRRRGDSVVVVAAAGESPLLHDRRYPQQQQVCHR